MSNMINNLQSILTQDHLATEAPVYTVYSKQYIVVDGDYSYDKTVYIREKRGEYEELDYETFDELETAYYAAKTYRTTCIDGKGNEIDEPMPKDPYDEEKDFDPGEWEQKFLKSVDIFEGAFFIRKNAEDFIESQSHHLTDPYIYVESAWRNPEWQQIRELLVDKARIESESVSV